jgi:hypothetical protein
VKRGTVAMAFTGAAAAPAVGFAAGARAATGTAAKSADASLVFGPDNYTELTTSTTDADGTAVDAYVVVEAGARGRALVDSSGVYYGTSPAAVVDLKAAVQYVKDNKGRIPGDVDALPSLLGASGDSPLNESHLSDLGAADASNAVFAVGS